MYYQGSYDAQSYGASYAMPFSYTTITVGADNSKTLKAEPSVPYPISSCDLTPITTDLVKKRLKDRYGLNCLLIGGHCNPSNCQFKSAQLVFPRSLNNQHFIVLNALIIFMHVP